MKKHEIAIQKLLKEYTDVAGKVTAEYFLRITGDDEIKKTMETADFMNALFTGKPLKEKWSLDKSDDFKQMQNLAKTINFLQSDTTD